MVTKERKYISIAEVEALLNDPDIPDYVKARFQNKKQELKVRLPKPTPPHGGISMRRAAVKYKISHVTISRWAKDGKILIIQPTKNEVYISEQSLRNYLKQRDN